MSTPNRLLRLFSSQHRNTERLRFGADNFNDYTQGQRDSFLEEAVKMVMSMQQDYQIGIVTALPKEFAAMVAMLDDVSPYHFTGDPNPYFRGVIRDSEGQILHHIVVTTCAKMGNNSAASTTTNLVRSFSSIKDVLMVGIAGGMPNPCRPEEHVRLGDIVVSQGRGIVQYDMVKLSTGQVELREITSPPSARMAQAVNSSPSDRRRCGSRRRRYRP